MMKKHIYMIASFFIVAALAISIVYFQKPVELKIGVFAGSNWGVPSLNSSKIIDGAIKRFEEQNPNVHVEYVSGIRKEDYSEWISKQALTGEMCDVFMVLSNDLSTFVDVGMLEDLSSFISNDKDFLSSSYFLSSYQSGEFNNKQYALPFESVPTLMYVNKTLLEKEGIEVPSFDWTWADFYRICKQSTKDTNGDDVLDQFGQYGYTWQNAVASNGTTIFDELGTVSKLDDIKVYEAIEYMRKLERLNQDIEVTSEMFDKGQVVFCPMRFSEYRTYEPYPYSVKKYTDFEWGCIPMPSGPQGSNVSELDTLLVGMSKHSKYKDIAWKFLKMLSYDENTQRDLFAYSQGVSVLNTITSTETIIDSLQDQTPGGSKYNLDFFNSMMEHAIPIKQFNGYNQAMMMADSEMRLLIQETQDVKTGILNLKKDLDMFLETIK